MRSMRGSKRSEASNSEAEPTTGELWRFRSLATEALSVQRALGVTEALPFLQQIPWGLWLAGATLLVALCFEFTFGEPPAKLHPVVWMGASVNSLMSCAPDRGPRRQLGFGLFVALMVPSGFAVGAMALASATEPYALIHVAIGGLVLSTTFSVRGLERAALDMSEALQKPQLEDADRLLLRSLCSRDPSQLDRQQLAAATLESVAENSSDSFVAPLFYFALFGLPGAVFYRAVNTLDAMIGYHGRYEYLGKAAARLDDLLNWLPARLCALLLLVAGAFCGLPARRGWRIGYRDHRKTESPNAGWPMAVMAGLLGVQLTKVDHYVLGDAEAALTSTQIEMSCRVARRCFYLCVAFIMGLHALTRLTFEP